jgi:hypothetical protein
MKPRKSAGKSAVVPQSVSQTGLQVCTRSGSAQCVRGLFRFSLQADPACIAKQGDQSCVLRPPS